MFLNCKTWFSFNYGTYKPAKLIAQATELGIKSLALTNINSTADCWDFVQKCQAVGIKPILGAEVSNANAFCYVLLAKNNAGLLAIHAFLSYHKQREIPFPERPHFTAQDVWVIYRYQESILQQALGAHELIGLDIQHLNNLTWQLQADSNKYVILHPVTYQ